MELHRRQRRLLDTAYERLEVLPPIDAGGLEAMSRLDADAPANASGDLLERGPIVEQLAQWVRDAPMEDGFVIGLTGPWGSGKTTILRMLEERLDKGTTVVWFEPWLFSDADQLVSRFFDEMALQLAGKRKRLRKLGRRLADYGSAVSPAAGIVVGPAGQLLAAPASLLGPDRTSAATQRSRLRAELKKDPQRIVVLIDDVDRLDSREVGEVLRLVKLVADLPGIVHVVSYDRARVEHALSQIDKQDGRAYLEKIVQASMRVPPVSRARLQELTLNWVDGAVDGRQLESWDDVAWAELVPGISLYLRTLRDGRRLANSAPAALDLCGSEVAATDVLALETIRVLDPAVHDALPILADALVGSQDLADLMLKGDEKTAKYRADVDGVLSDSTNPAAARRLLKALFPMASVLLGGYREGADSGWRNAKRVAAGPVFRRYLHLALPGDEVASLVVDEVLDALREPDRLQAIFDETEESRLADLLDRAGSRLTEQPDADVVGSAAVIMGLIPRIPAPRSFLGADPERASRALVVSLVEGIKDAPRRADSAQAVVRQAPDLSSRVSLFYRFRLPADEQSDRPRLDLIAPPEFQELQREIAELVMQAESERLASERQPLSLMQIVHDTLGTESVLRRLADPEVLAAVVSVVGSRFHPRTSNGVSIHLEPLVEIAGEDVIALLADLEANHGYLNSDLRIALGNALRERERSTFAPPTTEPEAS